MESKKLVGVWSTVWSTYNKMVHTNMDNEAVERVGFKKEFSNIEMYGVEFMINEFFNGLEGNEEKRDYVDDVLGLAYTSSSSYAMYSACNEDFVFAGVLDNEMVSHFGILNNNVLIMVTVAKNEDYRYYSIYSNL